MAVKYLLSTVLLQIFVLNGAQGGIDKDTVDVMAFNVIRDFIEFSHIKIGSHFNGAHAGHAGSGEFWAELDVPPLILQVVLARVVHDDALLVESSFEHAVVDVIAVFQIFDIQRLLLLLTQWSLLFVRFSLKGSFDHFPTQGFGQAYSLFRKKDFVLNAFTKI